MRYLRILLVAGLLAGVAALLYTHLTKDLETYGIHDAHARPISEQVPEGLADMKASTCGSCHTEIYAEWQTTIHARSWSEDYFQIDWAYDNKKQNCLNCHTPMKNQQTSLLVGFEDDDFWKPLLESNPDFDASFQQEGVTCAACHVRNGSVMGPHGVEDAPHATTYNPAMRSGMEVCVRCHVTGATNEVSIGSPNICTTMNEIEAGNIQPNCIDCHMPPVTRPLVAGYPARKGRHHYWRGGHDPAMVAKDLDIAIKQVAKKDGRFTYEINLTNIGTHHKLPTGTPDRNIVVTMSLLDEDKRIVKSKTHKIVRRILWRPIVFELSDNRLEFNKPQTVEFSFNIESSSGRHFLNVKADYNFLEQWRRDQLALPESSHAGYRLLEKVIEIQ
ncbi:MAG: multiheme c-type cytochrome [Granulosicoccus sp.]